MVTKDKGQHSRTIKLVTDRHRVSFMNHLADVPVSDPPQYEVVVRKIVRDRSAAQNSLYWLWLTAIGQETGESKEDLHQRYKGRFLTPIYIRDNPDYAAMVAAVVAVKKAGMIEEYQEMKKAILRYTSTTDANQKQFAEYLTEIEHDGIALKVPLPYPGDYDFAMGNKKGGGNRG